MNFLNPHFAMPSRAHMLHGPNLQSNLEEIKENAEDPQEEGNQDQISPSMMLNVPIPMKAPIEFFNISSSGIGRSTKGPRTITNIKSRGVS
jgi:hypothetical protein